MQYNKNKDFIVCLGRFKKDNLICEKHCALRLLCLIKYNKSLSSDFLDENLDFFFDYPQHYH